MANDLAKRLMGRVKQLREALGLTQESFAERAGLGYKYYQSVEAGRRRDIRLSTLEKLAKACGLELSELVDFQKEPERSAESPAELRHSTSLPARKAPARKRR